MSLLSQRRRRPALVVLGICLIHLGGPASLRATNEFQLFTRPLAISERGTVNTGLGTVGGRVGWTMAFVLVVPVPVLAVPPLVALTVVVVCPVPVEFPVVVVVVVDVDVVATVVPFERLKRART